MKDKVVKKTKYFQVDNEFLIDDRTDHFDIAVYCCLLQNSNYESKTCYPSQSNIATRVKLSRKKVVDILAKLERIGYVRSFNREGTSKIYLVLDAKVVYSEYIGSHKYNQNEKDELENLLRESGVSEEEIKKVTPTHPKNEYGGCYPQLQGVLPTVTGGVTHSYTNNTKINNTKNKQELFKDRGTAHSKQKNLFTKQINTTSLKELKTGSYKEQALKIVEAANNGSISWEDVRDRDFVYYYIEQHNKVFKDITFDRFNDVGIIKTFIKKFELPRDEVTQYINLVLQTYSEHPQKWDNLTFNMISKNTRLMNELVDTVKDKLYPKNG